MEALSLKPIEYDHSMSLVPCKKYTSGADVTMTMAERMQYRAEHGGYLSDCGVFDDWRVWG